MGVKMGYGHNSERPKMDVFLLKLKNFPSMIRGREKREMDEGERTLCGFDPLFREFSCDFSTIFSAHFARRRRNFREGGEKV